MSSLPIGWGNRQNADFCDPQALLQRPKAEDWKDFELEIKHMKAEEVERERLKKVAGMSNVPVGWAGRENAKPLDDLLMSKSSVSVAAAEAIYKKEYPHQDINELLFNKSMGVPVPPPVSFSSSSSASTPGPPAATATGSVADGATSAEVKEVKDLVVKMQSEMQQTMGNVIALLMEMGNRLAVLEMKVETLGEAPPGSTRPHQHLTSSY
jgi:hypothetical protein